MSRDTDLAALEGAGWGWLGWTLTPNWTTEDNWLAVTTFYSGQVIRKFTYEGPGADLAVDEAIHLAFLELVPP